MNSVVLDIATMRESAALLDGKLTGDARRLSDVSMTALSTFIEAVCFADEVIVPNLGHIEAGRYIEWAGPAVRAATVSLDAKKAIIADAGSWLRNQHDLREIMRLIGPTPEFGGPTPYLSSDLLVLQALGVEDKYSTTILDWLRANRDDPTVSSDWGHSKPSDQPSRYPDGAQKGGGVFWQADVIDEILHGLDVDDRAGQKTYLVHPDLRAFCTHVAWLMFRSRCYLEWAHAAGLCYLAHPLRGRVAGYAAMREGAKPLAAEPARGAWLYLERLHRVHREGVDFISDTLGRGLVAFPYLGLLPFIVRRAGKREFILEAAYEVRAGRGARVLREHAARFEEQMARGDLAAAVRLRAELDDLTEKLRSDLGLPHETSKKMTIAVGVPAAKLDFSDSSWLEKSRTPLIGDRLMRPWRVLLRDIFASLTEAAELGALYEIVLPPE